MRFAALALALWTTAAIAAEEEPTVVHLFGPGDPVVAEIDGQPILLSDVEGDLRVHVIKTLFTLDRQLSDQLEERVQEVLLEREASAAGMIPESWIEWKIDEKIWPVTLAEAKQHFKTSGYPEGTKFGQVREAIIAELTSQRRAGARTVVLDELRKRHQVVSRLTPFRLDLASPDDPSLGPPDAPVTIVEFSDFQCPYCARARATMHELLARYPDQVRLVARDFPLTMHPQAEAMAVAAACAAEQEAYWPYSEALFERSRTLQEEDLPVLAAELGLHPATFQNCLNSGHNRGEVHGDMGEGSAAGVTGTPTFFINGRMISGAQSLERFAEIVEEELGR